MSNEVDQANLRNWLLVSCKVSSCECDYWRRKKGQREATFLSSQAVCYQSIWSFLQQVVSFAISNNSNICWVKLILSKQEASKQSVRLHKSSSSRVSNQTSKYKLELSNQSILQSSSWPCNKTKLFLQSSSLTTWICFLGETYLPRVNLLTSRLHWLSSSNLLDVRMSLSSLRHHLSMVFSISLVNEEGNRS